MSCHRIKCFFDKKQSLLQIYVILKEYRNLEECLQSKEYDVNNGNYIMSFWNDSILFDGWTPLHISAAINDPESAVILLKYGADINARTGSRLGYWYTPLHIAIKFESQAMTRFLINSNADINAMDHTFKKPIELCLNNPSLSVLLIESGAEYKSEHFDRHPIIFKAIDERNLRLVEVLAKRLRKGVFFENQSPLEYAFDVFPQCVSHLIDSGVQIHFSNSRTKEYPIHVSVRMNRYDWIEKLCEKGCNTNVSDANGNRPLHIAVQNQCHTNIVLLLIAFGANVNLKNCYGLTPICYAVQNGNEGLTRLLLKYGTRLSSNLFEFERSLRFKKFNCALILLETIETIDESIKFDGQPIIWFFVKYCVGEHECDAKAVAKIMQKLIDMTPDVNTLDSLWGSLMHFLIYADFCSPTHCFKPMFDVLIRSLKCDINYVFCAKTTQFNGEVIVPQRIMANGTSLSFALEMAGCEYYAEELIRIGADHSTINWYRIFFAPKKAKALKMLVFNGCHIPDYFRDESNPAFDDSVSADIVVEYCRKFDHFIEWLDKRKETVLSLKQSSRNAVRKALGLKGIRQLAETGPQIFSPQFTTYPQILRDYILYHSYEDFE